jgi:hypothetical protein
MNNGGEAITKISDVLSGSLTRLYAAGGLALVLIFVGLILMIFGNANDSLLPSTVGACLIGALTAFFLYTQLRGPYKAKRAIERNARVIDAIQEIALELTKEISLLQSLLFRYETLTAEFLDAGLRLAEVIPGVRQRLEQAPPVVRTREFAKLVVDASTQAETVIGDVEDALTKADVRRLTQYASDLKGVTSTLRTALRTSERAVPTD